jgi:hypothetical protein
MKTEKINLHSRVGWAYRTTATNDENGYLVIEAPTKPFYIGTVRQVCDDIANDLTLNSLGGAYHSERWFVRKNKKWLAIDEPLREIKDKIYSLIRGYDKEIEFEVE